MLKKNTVMEINDQKAPYSFTANITLTATKLVKA